MIKASEVEVRLQAATSDRRLLDHPFYKAWAAGELTVGDLRHYSTQYWRQVESFPGYLGSLASRLEGDAAGIVEANLRDEVEDDHAGLWLRFAEALGASESEVRTSRIEPETTACVSAFNASSEASKSFALGMIYGYESQTPAVAETKIVGLRDHYGIEGTAADYFQLHGELDIEHSEELAQAISISISDEAELEEAAAGAAAGAEAIWTLLDGVERVRQEALA